MESSLNNFQVIDLMDKEIDQNSVKESFSTEVISYIDIWSSIHFTEPIKKNTTGKPHFSIQFTSIQFMIHSIKKQLQTHQFIGDFVFQNFIKSKSKTETETILSSYLDCKNPIENISFYKGESAKFKEIDVRISLWDYLEIIYDLLLKDLPLLSSKLQQRDLKLIDYYSKTKKFISSYKDLQTYFIKDSINEVPNSQEGKDEKGNKLTREKYREKKKNEVIQFLSQLI